MKQMEGRTSTVNRRRRGAARLALAVAGVVGMAGMVEEARGDLTADQTPFHSFRGLWMSRFEYNDAGDIRRGFANAASIGVTDMFFQVRGQADAYYYLTDGVETRASGISASYDPLAIAIAEGQARGIRVHAWINSVPLWRGTANAPAGHVYSEHPEYRSKGADGSDAPLRSDYVDANPARDDVQAHIANVAGIIAKNYDVAGIHLDHTRLHYNNNGTNNVIEYPSDPYTVSLFQQQYPGQTPVSNPANYKSWMAGRITELVSEIRQSMKAQRPDTQLTAAVWRNAAIGLNDYQQDWGTWVREGILDAAMPMIYHGTHHTSDFYTPDVTASLNHGGSAGIMPGLGSYLQTDPSTAYANTMWQLEHAKNEGANGVTIYTQSVLFNNSAASNEVLRALRDFFAINGNAPAPSSIANFDVDEGTFKWSVTASGSNRNVAGGTADRDPTTGKSGLASQRLVINKSAGAPDFFMRHLSGNTSQANFEGNLQFASIGSVGFWLKSTTPDVQVTIALDDTTTGDRGYFKNVVADGQWHFYEWFLNDVSHWEDWTGSGDGKIATRFSVDSIQFSGTQSATVWIDEVVQNAGAVAPNQWSLVGNGSWNNSANWQGGIPNAVGAAANLLRRAEGGATVTLPGNVTVGTLSMDNAAAYEIAGPGELRMDVSGGSAGINVINRGSHRISAPVRLNDPTDLFVDRGSSLELAGALRNSTGKALAKLGEGSLTIRGNQNHGVGASLAVGRGTVNLESDGGVNLAVGVSGGALLNVKARQRLASLAVANGGRTTLQGSAAVVAVDDLNVEAGGTLDLGWSSVVIHSDSPETELAEVTALVKSGRNATVGTGILSSVTPSLRMTTVAAIRNVGMDGISPLMESFAGESVGPDALLLAFTWIGDLNVDGVVDGTDYARINAAYSAGLSGYGNGDLNLDGRINASDYMLMDRAFLRQDRRLAGHSVPAGATVPEPSSMVLAGVLGVGMLMRRRSSRKIHHGAHGEHGGKESQPPMNTDEHR